MFNTLILAMLAGAPPAPPWIDHQDFPKALQEKALAATVRLKRPNGEGTAVRVKRIGQYAFYLTAAHVVGDAKVVELETFDAANYPKPVKLMRDGVVCNVFKKQDLAIIRNAEEPLPCINAVPEDRIPKGFPVTVFSIGCSNGSAPTLELDKIVSLKRVTILAEDRFGWCWQMEKVPVVGRSGGPLIDKSGFLVGICSGTSDKTGFYVDSSEIVKALREELPALLEPDTEIRK